MKLKVFTTADSRTSSRSLGVRAITVRRNTKTVSFSALLSREFLPESSKSTAYLAMDEDSKNDWYIAVQEQTDGYHICTRKPRTPTQSSLLYFCCGAVAMKFLEANKAKDYCSCLVSEKPVEIDGVKWYKIITSKPIRTK